MKTTLLFDFDGTLTCSKVNGQKVPSIIHILVMEKHLDNDYVKKAQGFFDYYFAIEKDSSLPVEIRKKAMQEWWEKHFALKIEKGLHKDHILEAVKSKLLVFRKGVKELLETAHKNNNHIIILSAAGLGYDSIKLLLERDGLMFPNIHIISNQIIWNQEGVMIDYKRPLLHTFNKFEFIRPEEVTDKVIIVGDNVVDAEMLPRNTNKNIKRIGIYDKDDLNSLPIYQKVFDEVWANEEVDFSKLIKFL